MDRFLNATHCDRCRKELAGARIMSWFTTETICMACSNEEDDIKRKLKLLDKNPSDYEGCGYIPQV